jgi:predicted ATP-grasp superfamily ATP-dependent carboligase
LTNVLVLSASASAINVIHALRSRPDIRLFVTDASPYASGLYIEGVTPLLVPRARDLENYRTALERILREHAIDVLLPTSDRDTEGIVELLERGWDPDVRLFRPPYAAFRILSNKQRLMEFLRDTPARIPRTFRAGEQVSYPAVVKPQTEGGTKGVHIVRDEAQLQAAVAALRRSYGNDYVVQEYIPGGTGSIHMVLMLYEPAGRLLRAVPMRSSLTFMTWGGGGNAGNIVDEPEPVRQAAEVIEWAGGWRGPICAEFKRHEETGEFYLLEVNCRLNGYSYLTTMNGLNFPAAIVDLLLEGRTGRLDAPVQAARSNFVLGFREKLIEHWVDDSDLQAGLHASK